jgi:hypothetical protein
MEWRGFRLYCLVITGGQNCRSRQCNRNGAGSPEAGQKSDLFREEILCKDTVTDQYVIVGDQLEKTDHAHMARS